MSLLSFSNNGYKLEEIYRFGLFWVRNDSSLDASSGSHANMAENTETQDLQKMKVPDLKKLLKLRGLPISGNKAELIARLSQVDDLGEALPDEEAEDILNEEETEADATLDESTEDDLLTEKENSNKEENAEVPDVSGDEPAHKVVKLGGLTEAERLASRAARFGNVSEKSKKLSRAERFGLPAQPTTGSGDANKTTKSTPLSDVSSLDAEKLKKRAERFGSNVSSALGQVEDMDRLKKRAERFGQITSDKLSKVDTNEKILKRKERFGAVTAGATLTPDEQAKKKLRAERFGLVK